MNVPAAVLAVGTTYLAYFNFIIIGRIRRAEPNALARHNLVSRTIVFYAYLVATVMFIASALFTSTGSLVLAALAMVVASLTGTVFRWIRPRR